MAQHDMVIDNGPGLAVRTDINAAIAALASSSAGAVEPTVKVAGQLWFDTATAKLKQRNAGNTAWIEIPNATGVVLIAGSTMTGPLVLPGNPSAALEAAPKQYVDTKIGTVAVLIKTSSGSYSKPAGLKFLEVEIWGGGGGGSHSVATAASQYMAGAGGGAGGYGRSLFAAAALSASTSYTVGSGGQGASPAAAGGTTTFGSMSATGGGVGASSGLVTTITAVAGGFGGVATGCDVNGGGQCGFDAIAVFATNLCTRGAGGSSAVGGGGRAYMAGTAPGENATGYGAGGSGSANNPSKAAVSGGNGSPGLIILKEYY